MTDRVFSAANEEIAVSVQVVQFHVKDVHASARAEVRRSVGDGDSAVLDGVLDGKPAGVGAAVAGCAEIYHQSVMKLVRKAGVTCRALYSLSSASR
jgi:hypothetical protein